MSAAVQRVVEELRAIGVSFLDGLPDRAHSRSHGGERSVFLVYDVEWRGRRILESYVRWHYAGQSGFEVYCAGPLPSLRFPLAVDVGHGTLEFYSADSKL